jgi:hypothetical protein
MVSPVYLEVNTLRFNVQLSLTFINESIQQVTCSVFLLKVHKIEIFLTPILEFVLFIF